MYLTPLLVCCLVAQIPPAAQPPMSPRAATGSPAAEASEAPPFVPVAEPSAPPPVPPPGTAAPTASPTTEPPAVSKTPAQLAPVEPKSARTAPVEILSMALAVPEGEKPRGRPMQLVEVLRMLPDRAAQLRATESYWRLAEATGDYNFAWDEYQQFERLKPAQQPDREPTAEQRILSTRLQAAKARLQDADVALVAAQYDLAGLIRLPAGQTLPLTADMPHVGPYRTELDHLYQGRAIPARAVLVDRTLPIRRSAIESRAAAVNAAADALVAAEEAHFEGRADLALVLSLVDELSRQRRAFLADVRMYNLDIAEYAMSAPTPPLDPQGLASMLIKLPAGSVPAGMLPGGALAPAGSPAGTTGIERAGFNQPIGTTPPGGLQPVPEGQLNLAPPPGSAPPPARNEPTLAPPRPRERPPLPRGEEEQKTPVGSALNKPQTAAGNSYAARRPTGAPEIQTAPADTVPAEARAEVNLAESPVATAGRPAATEEHAILQASPCLYPALVDRSPADQARQLAQVLCWEPTSGDSSPITLNAYLANVPSERRRDAITAYWQSQRNAALAQLYAQQLEQFEALGAAITAEHLGPESNGPTAMLLVRAAQLAAQADARNAQVDRTIAQWTLTTAAGRPLTDDPWLTAETPPHAGGYRLQLAELSRELADSAIIKRLAATIPQLRAALVDRAAAVIAADHERGNMTIDAGASLADTRRALEAITQQTAETGTFLARLTDYNMEIAAYANAVLPPATTSESLVQALVATKPSH